MKFLADMGLAHSTVAFLRNQEYDAVHLRDEGLQRLDDEEIVKKIFDQVVPFLSDLNFEYTKLWEKEYKEDKNLIWWYKWRLYKNSIFHTAPWKWFFYFEFFCFHFKSFNFFYRIKISFIP